MVFLTPVYTRHISSSRKTAQTEHTYSLTADTASIFTSHSMLSLHSVMDGGSSRMESEKGGVRKIQSERVRKKERGRRGKGERGEKDRM